MILHHVFNFFPEKNPKSDQNADFPDFWNYMVPYLHEIAPVIIIFSLRGSPNSIVYPEKIPFPVELPLKYLFLL